MKRFIRPALKVIVVGAACLVVLFLLLPFLETQAPQKEDPKKPTPQVFSSNPLTDLVSRVASFFKGKNKAEPPASAPVLTGQAAKDAPQSVYSLARASTQKTSGKAENAENSAAKDDKAAIQNEEGEWVLVRQTGPSGHAQGMHEVNATDSAYDRFIRQERAARYTPAPTAQRQEVPDSKWAKLFRPIKRILGTSDAEQAGGGLRLEESAAQRGTYLASSQKFNKEGTRRGSSYSRASMDDIYTFTPGANASLPVAKDNPFKNVFYPEQVFEQQAKDYANVVFPNPQTDEEKKAKQNLKQQTQQVITSQARSLLENQLQQDLQNAQEEDLLPKTLSCKPSALYGDVPACSAPLTPPSPEDVQCQYQAAWQAMEQKIGLQIPQEKRNQLQMLMVLGKVGEESHNWVKQDLTDDETVNKAYRQLLDRILEEKCQNKTCFWVANQYDPDTRTAELSDSITASGMNFAGAANLTHKKIAAQFTQELLENDEFMDKAEDDVALVGLLNNKLPPYYMPITEDELKAIHQTSKQAGPNNPNAKLTAFYAATPGTAQQINEVVGSPFATFYDATRQGDGSGIFNRANFTSPVEAGRQITQNIMQRVDDITTLIRENNIQMVHHYNKTQLQQEAQRIKDELKPTVKK